MPLIRSRRRAYGPFAVLSILTSATVGAVVVAATTSSSVPAWVVLGLATGFSISGSV